MTEIVSESLIISGDKAATGTMASSKLELGILKSLGEENQQVVAQPRGGAPAKLPSGSATTSPERKRRTMNDADIMIALGDEPQLIGDLSKPCALPYLLEGMRHPDLKTISGDTLARLIRGEFTEQLGPGGGYQIIDCRFPYEFDGGHIHGAQNIYTRGQLLEAFPRATPSGEEARHIYVFHCEFSSERGPKLLRLLRSHDRGQNAADYPMLDYPELYLLHMGYKEFYRQHGDLCEPRQYVPMLMPAHRAEYHRFRVMAQLSANEGTARSARKPRFLLHCA